MKDEGHWVHLVMNDFTQRTKISLSLSRLFLILLVSMPQFIYSQDKARVEPAPTLINEFGLWQNLQADPGDENWDDRFGPNDDLDDYDEMVRAIAIADSEIYIGGVFWVKDAPYWNHIAKWNGKGWSSLGRGVNGRVSALAVLGIDLYVGGIFTKVDDIIPANNIAKWNRVTKTWSVLESGGKNGVNGGVGAFAVHGNELYVGGDFTQAGGVSANHIAKWNPSTNTWTLLGDGVNGSVTSIAVSDTELYVGGYFTSAGGVPANNIAKWNGYEWSALGDGVNNVVSAIAILENDVYVGGYFTKAGGVDVNKVAKWNTINKNWFPLGSVVHYDSLSYRVGAMAATGSAVYISGAMAFVADVPSGIARWNPAPNSWSPLGSGITNGGVLAIVARENDVYVGGYFTRAGGKPSIRFAIWHEPPQSGNRAPVWSSLPELTFNEDDSLLFPIRNWFDYVTDADQADSTLSFRIFSSQKVKAVRRGANFLFTAAPNWFGLSHLKFVVNDRKRLADTTTLAVIVKPVNDAPVMRGLPDSLSFQNSTSAELNLWEFVHDVETPDSLLNFTFAANKAGLGIDFNKKTGQLKLSAPNFSGRSQLYVTVKDWKNAVARDTLIVRVESTTSVGAGSEQLPIEFCLFQNYPNPFSPLGRGAFGNSTTMIRFGLPRATPVQLEIYDLSGHRVATLLNAHRPAGYHVVEFDARRLASGTYFYRLTADRFSAQRKLLLVK